MQRMNLKFHSLRKEAALEFGGTAADNSTSLARQQQGEQAVAVVGSVLWTLRRHVTSLVSLMLSRWEPMIFPEPSCTGPSTNNAISFFTHFTIFIQNTFDKFTKCPAQYISQSQFASNPI